jgi:hypothetical protein
MSLTLAITLYLGLMLAMALLRVAQGLNRLEAGMAGLLWPVEILFTGIDAATQVAMPQAANSDN